MEPQRMGQVFEITDHTTATDWERFIADLEEILTQIRKDHRSSGLNRWLEKSEPIKFGDFNFVLSYKWLDVTLESEDFENCTDDGSEIRLPSPVRDLADTSNDFISKAHCLYRWYNLKRFIILIPKDDYIITEDKIKLIISSASIASSNAGSQIPIFVQIHHPRVNFYQGISEHSNIRVMYEMAFFKQGCKQYRYLSESINLFREKVGCSLSDPISATIRLNYCIEDLDTLMSQFKNSKYRNEDEPRVENPRNDSGLRYLFGDFATATSVESLISSAQMLSTSTPTEPKFDVDFVEAVNCLMQCKTRGRVLHYLHVGALWPPLSDKIISDTPVHSDLNPADAPMWTMRAVTTDPKSISMTAIILTLLEISCRHQSDRSILESIYEDWSNEIALVFEKFQSKILTDIMSFIFCDKSREFPLPSKFHKESNWLKSCKAAPTGSLTHRIAIALAVTSVYSDLSTLSRIWKSILCELRRLYEHSQMLPEFDDTCQIDGEESMKPDHGSCLLHQKLQMLNCCIRQKIRTKDEQIEKQSADESQIQQKTNDTTDEDEEFYDCESDDGNNDGEQSPVEPSGRLGPLEDLCLLDKKDKLYVPVTQDIAPLTEDALQDYTAAMTRLARESQDTISLKMYQSAGLVSDMSAFKAANPGCKFEDFVRWFSPKDWILDCDRNGEPTGSKSSSKSGRLTHRMLLPGGLWYELWDAAEPIPVAKQKLLFDHRKEAEKVLEYLSSMSVKELLDNIIPVLLLTSCSQLSEKLENLLNCNLKETTLPETTEASPKDEPALVPKDLIELLDSRNYQAMYSILTTKERQIHQIDELISLFDKIVDHIFDELKGFDELYTDRNQMRINCRVMSYQLAVNSEVIISKNASDDIRKFLAVLFNLQNESRKRDDSESSKGLHSSNLLNDNSLGRLLRNFGRDNRPTVKEFIIRCVQHRPYESGVVPALPQRLFCTITDDEFRLCSAFSEVCG